MEGYIAKTIVMLAVCGTLKRSLGGGSQPDIFLEAAQKISELGVYVNMAAEGV